MSGEPQQKDELGEDELEAENGELIPEREELTMVDPSGDALLGPPDLADPNQ
jgi:hypothetical protein